MQEIQKNFLDADQEKQILIQAIYDGSEVKITTCKLKKIPKYDEIFKKI